MKSILARVLAVLFFVAPAIARAQAVSLADKFFSGDRAAAAGADPAPVPEPAVPSGPFVFDPVVNAKLAAKLNIPVFYALPESAYLPRLGEITPTDGLWEFRHPGAPGAANPAILRVYLTPHENVAQRLAASGLIQTGDVLLTFRPEWGFQGAYPNIQMGISHAGMALVENGVVSNIDNPLTREYIGNLAAKHYKEIAALHIIRPRDMNAAQKANLLGWARKLLNLAPSIYPSQLSFNQDYFSPKYTANLKFVKTVARIALQQDKNAKASLYCSELIWALLSLRNCDPAQPGVFAQEGTPACIKPVFAPLPMLGDVFSNSKSPLARLGLSDGPLAVISSLGLPEEDKKQLLRQVFERRRALSPGHAAVAESLAPFFMKLEGYYTGIQAQEPAALQIMNSFNASVKPNYSPTSYLIDTLLPADSGERKMDVVGTIVFSD